MAMGTAATSRCPRWRGYHHIIRKGARAAPLRYDARQLQRLESELGEQKGGRCRAVVQMQIS
jgi:hypothetical protein